MSEPTPYEKGVAHAMKWTAILAAAVIAFFLLITTIVCLYGPK